jgi:Asp-tRNA(Asn)/Glu-tRNA(Gln) amidotransferase A subunit family amidase
LFGWSVADAVAAYQAIAPAFLAVEPPAAPAKLAVCIPDDPHIAGAIPEMKAALTRVADAFANAGHAVERTASPISFERLYSLQRSTMAYEAGRALRHLLKAPAGCVGEKLTALIREGLAIAANRYLDERCAISPWTALGGPIVSLPTGPEANGLPLGCLLASRPGSDMAMCGWASQLAETIS